MKEAEKALDIKEPSDWYKVSQIVIQSSDNLSNNIKKFKAHFGNSILAQYNSSLQSILQDLYPNYNWLPWKFENCPRNFWKDIQNQRKFLDWVGNQLNIKEMSDWYKVNPNV